MEKTKKPLSLKAKLIIAISVILVIGVILALFGKQLFILSAVLIGGAIDNYEHRWDYNVNFENCEAELQTVAEYLVKNPFDVLYDKEGYIWYNITDDYELYFGFTADSNSADAEPEINCPEKITAAIKKISEAFNKGAPLDHITVRNGVVSFASTRDTTQYGLVYSPHKKPTEPYATRAKDSKVYVKKICEGWYHVRSRDGVERQLSM